MRAAIVLATLLACGLVGAWLLAPPGASPPSRIVLVVVDTLRRDHLSPYGSLRETPNIAALAETGQVFRNAVAPFHQTSMSMGSLFTGRIPSIESGSPDATLVWNGSSWCGMARFEDRGERTGADAAQGGCLPPSLPTLGERMREAGYWTIGVASNQFLFDPAGFSRGFDDWTEVGNPVTGYGFKGNDWRQRSWKRVDAAVVEALERRESDDFFLYVHYMDAHDYGGNPAAYPHAVARVDHAFGLLMAHLEEAGLREDTVVILTADHGERLKDPHALQGRPGHLGNPSFQEVLRVPLIVSPPLVDDAKPFVRVADLLVLLEQVAGLDSKETGDLEAGELFVGERAWRTYSRGRWKSSSSRDDGEMYLFDLASDPRERRNVADQHPNVVEAHRKRMDELSARLGTKPERERALSPEDQERLRALGYLE